MRAALTLNSLSVLVHAASKVGKSTLGSTCPAPICVFDVEGSWRFIRRVGFCEAGRHNTEQCPCPPLRRIEWDPRVEAPPRHDGTWDFCHVIVNDWKTLADGYRWLYTGEHDFRSLAYDSITESQRRLKANLRGVEQMRMQDWGDLLVHMDRMVRGMRDLVLVPNTTLQVVLFIAETRLENGKWRPYMQGQIGTALPYWMDLVGYLYTDYDNDAHGQPTVKVKKLWIGDHAQFEAGERVQGMLGDCVARPNISTMFDQIFAANGGGGREETEVAADGGGNLG